MKLTYLYIFLFIFMNIIFSCNKEQPTKEKENHTTDKEIVLPPIDTSFYLKIYEDSMNIKVNTTFTIELDANHSTGYQWDLEQAIDSTYLEFIYKDYIVDTGKEGSLLIGVGGKENWSFKALQKGQTSLSFKYIQPFNPDTIMDKKTLEIIIE